MTSITVKKGDKLIFVKLEEVTHFEADEKYVSVYTDKEIHLIEQSLSQLELKLPRFFYASASFYYYKQKSGS